MNLHLIDRPKLLPGIEEIPNRMEDGVYFNLPDEVYHKHFALSASGIKHLRISSMDFWARSSALNPDYEDEDTDAKAAGRAYDCRILIGKEEFYKLYAPEFSPPDRKDLLKTGDQLKDLCRQLELPVSGNKPELIARLLNKNHTIRGRIVDLLEADYRLANSGKSFLPQSLIHRIEIATAMIENHAQLRKAFQGGYPHVSVFWTDEESGVPCKCQFDYLKAQAIADVKTLENMMGMPVDQAIARTVAVYKYHIQAAMYLDGANVARHHIQAGRVFGDPDPEFLERFVTAKERAFLFVFIQKGIAPLARGKVMPPGMTLELGRYEIDKAKALFAQCWKTYGTDPWLDIADIQTFDSTEFPAFISN